MLFIVYFNTVAYKFKFIFLPTDGEESCVLSELVYMKEF